jgi:DNA-binding NarL/FixJ family response regulator
MKVVIADDHRIVREGVAKLLESEADIDLVGEASGGDQLLTILQTTEVDVVLLDLRMPGLSGLDVLEEMQSIDHPARFIVLSMHDDPAFVKRAIELGAAGYLLKSVGKEELLRAIGFVADGGSYIQGEITAPLIAQMTDAGNAGSVGRLSERDVELLRMLADGLDNRAIAENVGISEAAVKGQLRTIYSRLEVKRRSEAVAVAIRLGII